MSTRARLAGVGAVVVLAVVLGLALCTRGGGNGGNGPGPGGGPSGSLRDQAKQVTGELLATTDAERPAAGAAGTVDTYSPGGPQPAVAEVLTVEAGPKDTLLRWRLKSTGPLLSLNPGTLGGSKGGDARGVAVLDPSAQKLFLPPLFRTLNTTRCVCSLTPTGLDGRGQVLTGIYLPLAPGTSRVEIRIPGFPPIPDVPVKRG